MGLKFDVDAFVSEVLALLDDPSPELATKAAVERALRDPSAVLEAIGPKFDLRRNVLHSSERAFISLSMFPPGFRTGPHDHGMWAVTGTCAGHEDTTLYRRQGDTIERICEVTVDPSEVLFVPRALIHDVMAGGSEALYSIHVYPGSLVSTPHSLWVGEPPTEQPFDTAGEWSRLNAELSAANLVADA